MANTNPARKHWTEAQQWKAQKSGRILTAGELLAAYRQDLLRCPSLCCATFTVRAGDELWARIS
jgi:hypothetical protein